MCEHWHEPTNTRFLVIALMVAGETAEMNWAEGKPIQLWEIRPGVFAWTFSYHQIGHESEPVYHWHSSLTYYQSEGEAKEAMANFVAGLNATWSKVNAENS